MSNEGDIRVIASIDTSAYKRGASEIEEVNERIEGSTERSSSRMTGALKTVGKAGFTALAATAVAAIATITASIPRAVRRVDTLNNSSRTFKNMGFESSQSAKAIKRLEESIMGLPTPLDSAIRGMTSLAATYSDVNLGQKVFTSLNNAILGFGGSAAMVDNAIMQLSQLPMDGPLDAQTWNSLRNSGLTPVLVAMANESGTSVSKMKKAFGEGELTVKDFTDRLIEMNERGGGGMKSLEQIAKDSTSGIGTGFANMQTAITRGVAKIIDAIGSENITKAMSNIGKAFEIGLTAIANTIVWLSVNIPKAIRAVQEFGQNTVNALISAWQSVSSFFTSLWGSVTSTFNSSISAIRNGLESARRAVIGLVSSAINTLNDALQATVGWLKDNRVWLTNVGIVIGTLLLPMMMKLGWEALKTGAAWAKSMATITASAIATAARTTAAFIMMSASAAKQAAISSAAWVAGAAVAAFQWVTVTLPSLIATFTTMAASAIANAVVAGAAWVMQAVQVAARWAATFGLYASGVAVAAAQTLAAGARMAAAWLLAMGPIGLIVAAVAGATALIIANWSTVKDWMASFWNWLTSVGTAAWNGVRGAWSGAVGFFSGVVSGITSFFSGLPSRIKNFFLDAFNAVKNINWMQLGIDIISGIVSGLNPSRITEKMKEIASGAMDTVKSFLGIKSPSRAFMEIGNDIMAGWARGLDAAPIVGAMKSATSDLVDIASPFSNMSGSFNVTGGNQFDEVQGGPGTQVSIGNVYISSEVDGERWLRRLSGNQEIVSNGLVPTQSYM